MEYLWNMQGRLHKIYRKIFTVYSDEIFSRNISCMSSNIKFHKHSRNIPADDFKRLIQ